MIGTCGLAVLIVFIASLTAASQVWPHAGGLDPDACQNPRRAVEPVPRQVEATVLCVVQERTYRRGIFLVVDALVENISPNRVERAEVSVEFYDFFDELVSFEYTVLLPRTLGPGHKGVLRVATPFNDAIRTIRYRFTWWRDGTQFQNMVERVMRVN